MAAFSNFGSPQAQLATQGGSMLDTLSPTPQGFDEVYQQPKGLGVADAASNVALMSGNPIAMGVGGAYKLAKAASGDFGMKDKFRAEQTKARQDYFSARHQKAQRRLMSGFNTSGVMNSQMYEYGGPLGDMGLPEYIELEGPSHEDGGINFKGNELEGGEVVYNDYVFSKKLGYADKAKKIARRGYKNYGLNDSADPIARNTAMRQKTVNEAELTDLMYEQENERASLGLMQQPGGAGMGKFANGGDLTRKEMKIQDEYIDSIPEGAAPYTSMEFGSYRQNDYQTKEGLQGLMRDAQRNAISSKNNETLEQNFKQWTPDYENYLKSPSYGKVANKTWGDSAGQMIETQLEQTGKANPMVLNSRKNMLGFDETPMGKSIADRGQIGLRQDMLDAQDVYTHEMSHFTERGDLDISKWNNELDRVSLTEDQENNPLKEESYWYLRKPTELRARVNSIRELMNREDFDYLNATEEDIEEYVKRKGGRYSDQYEELKRILGHKPGQIQKVFREFAMNNNTKNKTYGLV